MSDRQAPKERYPYSSRVPKILAQKKTQTSPPRDKRWKKYRYLHISVIKTQKGKIHKLFQPGKYPFFHFPNPEQIFFRRRAKWVQ